MLDRVFSVDGDAAADAEPKDDPFVVTDAAALAELEADNLWVTVCVTDGAELNVARGEPDGVVVGVDVHETSTHVTRFKL